MHEDPSLSFFNLELVDNLYATVSICIPLGGPLSCSEAPVDGVPTLLLLHSGVHAYTNIFVLDIRGILLMICTSKFFQILRLFMQLSRFVICFKNILQFL